MYDIIKKKKLNADVVLMRVAAPEIAAKARPGQFVILRADSEAERIPLTIADYSAEAGEVTIIFQRVGASTMRLAQLKQGDCLADIVGPLGKPTDLAGLKKAAIIGGGVGCAIAYPLAKALRQQGCEVDAIVGFRNKDLIILEDEFKAVCRRYFLRTDDGSAGEKGLVTDALRKRLEAGEAYDRVIAIGPLIMMKFVCKLTQEFHVPTEVSMNPIMIDGTGMCGCCRLTVGGQRRFACVDGPDFDGHQIDWDEALARGGAYAAQEAAAREKACRLFGMEK